MSHADFFVETLLGAVGEQKRMKSSKFLLFLIRYEKCVWNYLTNLFKYNLNGSELGITNDLVYRVINFSYNYPAHCDVYISQSKNENIRGADIDFFVESEKQGYYYHYMLQAKILTKRGKYLDIRKWTLNAQYDKLIKAAKTESAIPYYLLYNGNSQFTKNGTCTCMGLSIISAETILDLKRSGRCQSKSISFDDLIAEGMAPFHCILFNASNNVKCISEGEIYTGFPYVHIKNINKVYINDGAEKLTKNSNALSNIRIIIKNDKFTQKN